MSEESLDRWGEEGEKRDWSLWFAFAKGIGRVVGSAGSVGRARR